MGTFARIPCLTLRFSLRYSLVNTNFFTSQATATVFWLLQTNMPMTQKTYFSKHVIWTHGNTFIASPTLFCIDRDMLGFEDSFSGLTQKVTNHDRLL
ncbi:hypothetical protein SAMN02745123_02270 [Desulforamulus aeronauticus DSM 10349]|uniref:Uncharacterized protein n=1 Tax=Desulforamulus aeronauticus DSM 10349 TaxID=1121421 RepID=A0A1M6TD32_9FIRM|nr:hypothetical protein SAMN02745123_02270 [Desulforamulus aeronauticus DSM 10349]